MWGEMLDLRQAADVSAARPNAGHRITRSTRRPDPIRAPRGYLLAALRTAYRRSGLYPFRDRLNRLNRQPADRCEVCGTPLHPLVIAAGTTVHATCEPVEREEVRATDGLAASPPPGPRASEPLASRGCGSVAGFGASPVVEAVRLNEPRFLEMGSFEHPRSHLFSLRSYHQGGEVRIGRRSPLDLPAKNRRLTRRNHT